MRAVGGEVTDSSTEASRPVKLSVARAYEFAHKAISLDDSNAAAYSVLGVLYGLK